MHTMNHPDFQRIPGDLCVYWIRGDNLPCSDQLIALAAEKWCTENGHTPFRADVLRPKFEKPSFVHAPDIHFSVSHSENYWVCIMDHHPVGIDLQFNQRVNAESIARRHFHPLEALWLEKHPEDFFRIWTAKEAFVKYTGKGIDNDFDAFAVVNSNGFKQKIEDAQLRFIPFFRGYTLALVRGN